MEIQSEAFVFNFNLSIEVSNCDYHDKYRNYSSNDANVKMDFHPHFSDDSAHNTATICEHMKTIIHWMYEEHLFIHDGIIYDTTDGCNKQYVCANELWQLLVLSFTYRGIIYR